MTTEDRLAESHIREYESRLAHIDELVERASQVSRLSAEHFEELKALKRERATLADNYREIKGLSKEEWEKKGGPMVLWELVAERLEKLVERLE